MAKINFQQFKIAQDIAHKTFTTVDLREDLGNHIYKERSGVAALSLAMKIYRSEGETDYDEAEVELLRSYIENSKYNCSVLEAFTEAVGASSNEEKNEKGE